MIGAKPNCFSHFGCECVCVCALIAHQWVSSQEHSTTQTHYPPSAYCIHSEHVTISPYIYIHTYVHTYIHVNVPLYVLCGSGS